MNSSTDQNNDAQSAEGNYLADLITFLADFYYANPSNSPVRALWFTGANQAPDPDLLHRLGRWNYNGSVQYIDDRQAGGLYCPDISNLNGAGPSEDYIYSQMVLKVRQSPTTGCY